MRTTTSWVTSLWRRQWRNLVNIIGSLAWGSTCRSISPRVSGVCTIKSREVPFQTLHVDHPGPFNRSSGGKKYILVVIDGFTKFASLFAVKDTKTAPVMRHLRQLFVTYGTPARIITYRGMAFTARTFVKFCSELGIKLIQNAVAMPRANGKVERLNSTILSTLSTSVTEEN